MTLAGALVAATPAGAVGTGICLAHLSGTSSFEPTQGVWQDDSGAFSFGDKPGKQLNIGMKALSPGESPAIFASAELPMVENRPTLIFGTQRPGGDRMKITLKAMTSGVSPVPAFVRFKLSYNGGAQQVLYESAPAPVALAGDPSLANPCGGPQHEVTFTVPTPQGIPDGAIAPFQFTQIGDYQLTAVVVPKDIEGHEFEFQQIKTATEGKVVATHPPRFVVIPATLTNPAPDEAAQAKLKRDTDTLATDMVAKLASYMPIPITPQVRASATSYKDYNLTKGSVLSADQQKKFQEIGVLPQALTGTVNFQRLVNELGFFIREAGNRGQYDRTIVVMRPDDFGPDGADVGAPQAITASRKVIFVKDDSSQYTVGHEFSHTLCSVGCTNGYLWSRAQMLADCPTTLPSPTGVGGAYHNSSDTEKWAHGYQLFDEVNVNVAPVAPHYNREPIDLPSIMQSTTETEAQWLDQCTYRNDLQQLQNIPDPPVILVSGLVGQRRGRAVGTLLPVYELDSQIDLTAHAGGPWAIVLRGRRNRVLGRFPFTPAFGYDDPRLKRIVAAIQYGVPALPGVSAIDLQGPGGRLDRLVFSARAPRVQLRASVAPSHAGHRKAVRVSWRGNASRGRPLLYTLLDSTDGGQTWAPVFIERAFRSARVSAPPGSQVVLKLIATDGSRSATAQRTIAVRR